MNLVEKKCVPYEGGTSPLRKDQVQEYLEQLQEGWKVIEDKKIQRRFRLDDFKKAIDFLNKVAGIAEQENHHPDMKVFGWNKVEIELSTHAVGGLSENDFILAAKIDQLQ